MAERRKRIVETENGVRYTNLSRYDFREKYPNGEYNYDREKRVYRQDVYYGLNREQIATRQKEFVEETKEDNTTYFTLTTYLYSDKRGRKEEFRIHIYTNEPNVDTDEIDRIMEKFFDEAGFFVDWSNVTGTSFNEEIPRAAERLNLWVCTFLRGGVPMIRKNYSRRF